MRVLVTVNDAFGHVLPLAPLVRELRGRGHDVRIACPGPTAGRVFGDGVLEYRPAPVAVALPPPPDRGDHAARLHWALTVEWPGKARGWAPALLADARAFAPDAVLCEPVEHAGPLVAAALGVPLVEHGWGFSLPDVRAEAAQSLSDLSATVGSKAVDPVLRLDFGPDALQADDIAPGIVRYRLRPWSLDAPAPAPPAGRPRVLVTLGTYPHQGSAERRRVVAGAAAAAGEWEVVVVLGHPDRGDATGWPAGAIVVPLLDVPAELDRCALVAHHGGAGISWASLVAGVPAVCLPQAGDQFRNAGLLARAGAAVVVPPETTGPEAIGAAFATARDDPAYAAAARRVRAANADLPDVGSAADLIERV